MSTLSGSLNSASSAVVADFYRPLRPDMSDSHYLNVARLMTMLWGLSRLAVALAAIQLLANRSVIDGVLSVAGFTTGMILGLFLLGRMPRPVAFRSALAGLVAGSLVVLALWLPTSLAWPWYPLVGTVVTVGAALIVDRTYIHHGPSRNGSPEPGLDES